MSEKITVYLPEPAAQKLYLLRASGADRKLVDRLEIFLANSLFFSGGEFAIAPPVATVAGGAPLLHVKMLRTEIQILTTRIDGLFEDDDTADALVEIDFFLALRLMFEREEEFVIVSAAADGIAIDRRPYADPRAVLGIVEIMPIETAAAA